MVCRNNSTNPLHKNRQNEQGFYLNDNSELKKKTNSRRINMPIHSVLVTV